MAEADNGTAAFTGLVDLAAASLGGQALGCSDDFFAGMENLLLPGRGVFIPGKYTEQGKWMDGWESRRRRTPGHDWCIIRLGARGQIRGLDIDCNHFLGNHPPYAAVDACSANPSAGSEELEEAEWTEILPLAPLRAGAQNLFAVHAEGQWTHVRLRIYPDGGVARFRVFGQVVPDPQALSSGEEIDLVGLINGGRALACSDMFFGGMNNLLLPKRAVNMGEGWESRRRRGPGHDWVIIELAGRGVIRELEVDTNHFKGNYPDRCSLEGLDLEGGGLSEILAATDWFPLLPERSLSAHHQHRFGTDDGLADHSAVTHVRLRIYPDGGVSRLRARGTLLERRS